MRDCLLSETISLCFDIGREAFGFFDVDVAAAARVSVADSTTDACDDFCLTSATFSKLWTALLNRA